MRRGCATRGAVRVQGFSLLEAIVALVIFSMGALALYAWLGTNVQTLFRVQELQHSVAATNSALDVVRGVNPMSEATGKRNVEDFSVEWASRPLQPPKPAVTQVGLPTIFEVGLYVMDVRVRVAGVEVDRFQVRQVGYRQVGTLEDE